MQGQLLDRLEKAEKKIVDLYKKLESSSGPAPTTYTYSRDVFTLPVPTLNQNVTVNISSVDTIITFAGALTSNFNLNITTGSNLSKGDRIYLMVKGGGLYNSINISIPTILNPITCGTADTVIEVFRPQMQCHEMVYDGEKFTGIDNC